MKQIFLIVGFLFLTGCSVTTPYVTEYRIDPKVAVAEKKDSLCRDKTVKISQIFTSDLLMSKNMNYAGSGYDIHQYTESEWANTPSRAISAALIKSVREAAIFANVSSQRSRSRADLILETNVDTFMQYYTKDNSSSSVVVNFSFTLIDFKSGKVVASKMIQKEQKVDSVDAKGGVDALNNALSEVLYETNSWLKSSCR